MDGCTDGISDAIYVLYSPCLYHCVIINSTIVSKSSKWYVNKM